MLNNITEQRLQLRRNGYEVIPNLDKRSFIKKWPKLPQTEDEVRKWERRQKRFTATGIRLGNGLAVIDIDVIDPEMVESIGAKFEEMFEEWGIDPETVAIRGTDATCKEAWFVRTTEPFNRLHTYRWMRPGADPDDPTAHVEIFGGASARQFGSYGPHTVNDRGEVLVTYKWREGPQPVNTPLGELPELSKQQFADLAAAANDIFARAGYQKVKRSKTGEDSAYRVYDLTEDMKFDCNDGQTRSLAELRTVAGSSLRCSASWLEGPSASRTDRCLVSLDRGGGVSIWETSAGTTHREKARKPCDDRERVAKLAEKLSESRAPNHKRIEPQVYAEGEEMLSVATKLLTEYAYCPNQDLSVVPLWATFSNQGKRLSNFRSEMMPWKEVEIGPRGGERKVNPVDVWLNSDRRITVEGLRLRPDMPIRIYEEGGKNWLNIYAPPVHEAMGGSIDLWREFMAYLLPDEKERAWYEQWLAHKFLKPWIPGPAVVMVACKQGSGRGTLGEILKHLFGRRYVTSVPFQHFAGKTYQSQYNDWQVGALIALVNESMESEGSAYKAKHATYEHLKEMIEPRAHERMVIAKGINSYPATSFVSYQIATNNIDALPITEDDRRFAVLLNGPPAPSEFWKRLNEWMDDEANIAALANYLKQVDLSDYSPYVAPAMTTGKQRMVDANVSPLEEAFNTAVDDMPADAFTRRQIEARIEQIMTGADRPASWKNVVGRLLQSKYPRIGIKDGTNWFIKEEGMRRPVYARNEQVANQWQKRTGLREYVAKNEKILGDEERAKRERLENLTVIKGERK